MDWKTQDKKLDSEDLTVRPHNQVIHFDNKTKGTLLNIVKVWADTWTHIVLKNGREYIINPDRVLYTELHWLNEGKNKKDN